MPGRRSRPARFRALSTVLFIGLAALFPAPLSARHPISITQVSAYVEPQRVTVAIDLFLEDLFLFHNLKPTSENRLPPKELKRGIERHKAFLRDRFRVLDAEGQPLAGEVVGVQSFEIPPDGIPLGDLMNYSLTYTLRYALAEPPRFLIFSQQFVDESAGIPVEMSLRVKQAGVEGDRVWALQTGKPETVDFDWDRPPPDPDASKEEWDAWMKKKEQATLGITSYSSVYSFLYIEDGEVRHEILVPLVTLEENVLIPRDDDPTLDLEEQAAAREQIGAFFAASNPIAVDGKRVTPEVARIDFYGLNFTDFAKRAAARPVPIASARVGVILRYPTRKPPDEVALTWDFYNDFVYAVKTLVYTDREVRQTRFSNDRPEEATYRWRRRSPWRPPHIEAVPFDPQQLPAASFQQIGHVGLGLLAAGILAVVVARWSKSSLAFQLGVAGALVGAALYAGFRSTAARPGARQLDTSQQIAIFERLHRNLYRAFRYQQEEPLYDALAISVDGPLLRDLYLQIRRSLVMREQGGAVSRIQEVGLHDLRPIAAPVTRTPSFRVLCLWDVRGTVEHWGHIHARTNEYEARFTVSVRDGAWKITGIELVRESQTNIETRLRGLSGKS